MFILAVLEFTFLHHHMPLWDNDKVAICAMVAFSVLVTARLSTQNLELPESHCRALELEL